MPPRNEPAFVLVHGTSHGGWCWQRVTPILQAAGHPVYAPSLTGCGDRVHLLTADTNLDTHIADIVNLIRYEELHNVVLVGHSYGGWVISGVVEQVPERIGTIAYLDAFMPEDGMKGLDIQSPGSQVAVREAAARGETSRPAGSVDRYNILRPEDKAWVESMLTPQPVGVSLQPLRLTGARDRVKRKVFVRCANYPHEHFGGYHQKLKDDPAWEVHALPCGHDLMIDLPRETAEILLGLV